MNLLQEKEFELLADFVEVCAKLDLSYYLVCGSALGAVKYQGFIPWDDDIDVALPRADYERFQRSAQDYLRKGHFLQNFRTDPAYPNVFSKLRDSNTTYIEKSVRSIDMNHGVYIDVFPLDGYPKGFSDQLLFEVRKWLYRRELISTFTHEGVLKNCVYGAIRLFGAGKRTREILESYEELISSCDLESSELWCNHGSWQGRLEYASREQYSDGIAAKFEGLNVRIPRRYDEYLTQKYGNWREDPPKSEQVGHHWYEVCDVEHSYKEYLASQRDAPG